MNDFKRRTIIGVMGSGDPALPPELISQAEEVGRLIALSGAVLLCGGRTGIMEAAARGAKSVACGETLAVLPGSDKEAANPFMDIVVATGMGNARNVINVLSSDSIVAFPGGAGTLSEIALAVKSGMHTISLGSWDPGKWRDASDMGASDAGSLDAFIHNAKTPEEAVAKALQYARGAMPDLEEIESRVREILESRAKAWNECDTKKFCKYYMQSPDLVVHVEGMDLVGFDDVRQGIDNLLNHPHKMPFPKSTDLEKLHVQRMPGNAFAAFYHYGAPEEDEMFSLPDPCMSLFVPCNGRLKVIADHL